LKAGVEIRILGRLDAKISKLKARRQPQMRLHTRTIIRDRSQAFIGSQSLRALELDARREVGMIFREAEPLTRLRSVFEADWGLTEEFGEVEATNGTESAAKVAKKVAKAVTRDMLPLKPILEDAVKAVVGEKNNVELNADAIEETIKDVVKEAVKEAVRNAVEEDTGK